MKKISKEKLQNLFGPNVLELTTHTGHFGPGPYLVIKDGISTEEIRKISKKFSDWRHQIFLESLGLKTEQEWIDFVTKPRFCKIT